MPCSNCEVGNVDTNDAKLFLAAGGPVSKLLRFALAVVKLL